jgi:quercetin dioxygenase-like cupin family protein
LRFYLALVAGYDFQIRIYNVKQNKMNTTAIFSPGQKLPNGQFTGNAFLTPLVPRDKNNDFTVGSLTYEAGTRSNWHTHPKGQILVIIEGEGFYQEKGKPALAIKKGDVVIVPENIAHWHGASAISKMVDIAITNYEGDEQATWLQPVTDEEYNSVQ